MFKSNIIQTKDLSHSLFLGADIHKNNHTFVALNNLEQKVGQYSTTDEERDLRNLRCWVEELKTKFKGEIILGLEDSNGNGKLISKFLSEYDYQLYNINPCLTAQRRKRTIHQDKSDEEDALLVAKTLISEIDNLSQIKITRETETASQLKGMVDDYDSLVKNQTQIKNQLHKVLYQEYGAEYQRLFKDPFSKKALKYWLNQNERAYKSLDPDSGLAVAPPQLENIRKLRIRQKVKYLIFIQEQLKGLTGIIKKLFSLLPYQNLLTLPGCGILLGSRVVSEIKDISRFENSSKLARYAGISPQENSSGQSKKHKRSRFGNCQLNKAFYRISLSQIGGHKNAKAASYYQRKIKEGKNKKRALKSLVRRNVNIVFAMMRDKSEYDINYKRKS